MQCSYVISKKNDLKKLLDSLENSSHVFAENLVLNSVITVVCKLEDGISR